MATTQRSFAQSVWDFFCSLKLTISLLISLALTSIIGTVLPQGQLPPEYIAQITPLKLQIYSKLGFFDMYHSWWFIALLYVFSVNLTCCSIKRLPHVLKFISEPLLVVGENLRNSFSLKKEITFATPLETGREKLTGFLKSEFAIPIVTEHQAGEYHLFAQKNAWCRLGVYVVHLSILVIFIGAIIGSLFGYKGYVSIVEGTGITSFEERSGKQMPLGFEVRCEKFDVDFYPTGAPKEFRSTLTVLENGKPVSGLKDVKVIVNKPLSYKGITFYQSSYGKADEGGEHYFTVTERTGNTDRFPIAEGRTVTFKNGTTFKLLEAAQEVRQFMPEFSGPAARVEVTTKGKAPQTFIVLKNFPEVNAQRGDEMIFNYEGSNARMYTGLQVAKDPGVWVVWLGCALMVIGLYIAFFMSHKRIWIIVTKGHARMYGNASKNQAGFSIQFDTLIDKLKNLKI